MASNRLPVDSLGHLDGGDGGKSVVWILNKKLQPKLSQPSVELVSTEFVSPPAVLQSLRRDGCQALPEGVHGVDRTGVVIHPPFVWPAVPVLAQPAQVWTKLIRNFIQWDCKVRSPR